MCKIRGAVAEDAAGASVPGAIAVQALTAFVIASMAAEAQAKPSAR